MVPYSPLGRGFFGGKAAGENLPINSFLVYMEWKICFCHFCRYLVRLTFEASAVWYKPTKNKGSSGSVSAVSPMLKLAK